MKITMRLTNLIASNLLVATLLSAMTAVRLVAADTTNVAAAPLVVTPSKSASRTVGLNIANRTVNPDKTTSLTFKWSEKGKTMERTVIASDKTIVVVNGEIKKFSDLPDAQFHAKAVATVGADGVTAVLLRFGKKPLPKDQLTPEQAAMIASLAPAPTAASDAALNKRVTGIVDSLNLPDAARQERVRAVLTTNLRAVREAHNAGLQLAPEVHSKLIAGLKANLNPEQIEAVKDKLTANKLPITFKTYHQIIPNLKPADDAKIRDWLQQAREESLDVKNVEDMNPIFKKYKTEIEHYLNSQGYDWTKSYKAFVDGQKSGAK